MTAAFEARLDFRDEAALVRLARDFVARTLQQWELHALVDDAVLVASELSSNAVLHARTEISLSLRSDGVAWVRIELRDHNSRMPTQTARPDEGTSGRGLTIVERLADSWGVVLDTGGKTVWAEVGHRGATGPDLERADGGAPGGRTRAPHRLRAV